MICLDASVAVKLVLEEAWSEVAAALFADSVRRDEPVIAPPLLRIEVTNILFQRTRSAGGMSVDEAIQDLDKFLQFAIEIRNPAGLHRQALTLAHVYRLPAAYDAHYLALAQRFVCDLWTDDHRLLRTIGGRLPFVRALADYDGAS
jgi:predicted nucleic acid-binding protein